MFVFAPLLWIIATTEWIPSMVVVALGAIITLYHGGKAVLKALGRVSGPIWINLIHVIVVGPVLVARGLYPATDAYAEFVRMLAFAALGYHAYYLLVPSQ